MQCQNVPKQICNQILDKQCRNQPKQICSQVTLSVFRTDQDNNEVNDGCLGSQAAMQASPSAEM